jgi:LPS-assembly lipoprotein
MLSRHMLSRRRLIVGLLPFALSACSFRPLYGSGPGAAASADLSSVAVPELDTRAGQLVRNELLHAMSERGGSYLLKLQIGERVRGKSQLPNTLTQRQELTLNGQYDLIDARSGARLESGSSFSTVAFDVVRQPVADLQARNAARERAAIELAGDIRLRVAVFFSKRE